MFTNKQQIKMQGWVGGAPERGNPPEVGVVTLPTTLLPLVGSLAREVSDLAVFLNVIGVEVGAQW